MGFVTSSGNGRNAVDSSPRGNSLRSSRSYPPSMLWLQMVPDPGVSPRGAGRLAGPRRRHLLAWAKMRFQITPATPPRSPRRTRCRTPQDLEQRTPCLHYLRTGQSPSTRDRHRLGCLPFSRDSADSQLRLFATPSSDLRLIIALRRLPTRSTRWSLQLATRATCWADIPL